MDNLESLTPSQLASWAYQTSRIVDHTLDDANLEARCPLGKGRYLLPPQHTLGQLDMLPLELLTYVLLALDIPCLTTFRCVNRAAIGLVDSLHPYRVVLRHCPDILRAIVSIDARSFDCSTLYETLSATKCEGCDRAGNYLYLITCKRLCHFCHTTNPDYFPVTATPGKLSRRRIRLFDRQAVLKSALTGDESIRQEDLTYGEPSRFMAIISAPFLDSTGLSADWGYFCAGCRESKGFHRNYRNKYTASGIVDHIRRYGPVGEVDLQPGMRHVPTV
ncbi:hypothetical protein F5Y17DRAFT_468947 [Xylariaceae sp. FL0594]|nr:hypothetical protein F5Y17DRAFT_468947 [Xylariaceae sp. FL0594]